jgi:hypothetical protein
MIKKLLFLLAAISLITNISGCTSKKAQDETEIVENADVDKIEADSQALQSTPTGTETTATATDDVSLQAALGETSPVATDTAAIGDPATANSNSASDNLSLDSNDAATDKAATATDIASAPTLDESSLNDIPPPTDATAAALTETPLATDAPPTDTSADTSFVSKATTEPAPIVESNMSTPKPAKSVLKKISAVVPYQSATGAWINTVYVARPKEKLKDISMKIYNADKTKELKNITENSYLKNHSVKAGDKIYYSSPNRPDDSTKMILYYEDMGMVPETYVAKKGDRLKKVSKEILGYDKAWVEVWASNAVESKDKLNEGETIKYWRSASSLSSTDIAQNTQPTTGAAQLVDQSQMPKSQPPEVNPALAQNVTPPPADMNSLPPPPPPPDMNTPPPPDMNSAAPPPPPPPDMNTPPPPPPPDATATAAAKPPSGKDKKKFTGDAGEEETSAIEGLDQDTMMSIGAVAVLTIALAFVLIRRRKKKAAEQIMTEDNVGT